RNQPLSEPEIQELLNSLRYPKEDMNATQALEAQIREFTDVFKTPSQPLTCTHLVQHRIITEHNRPITKLSCIQTTGRRVPLVPSRATGSTRKWVWAYQILLRHSSG